MEFPNLGKQCSNTECKQLDFVPLKCLCGSYLCKEHFTNHCQSGVCDHYKSLENKNKFTNTSIIYKCTFDGCDVSSYIKMPCLKCSKHFCIEHRFHIQCPEIDPELLKIEKLRWEQPKQEFSIAKANVEAQITKNLRNLQQSSTKAKTALKIQLMKLKSNAKGENNIPVVDRVYFAIIKPKDYETKKIITDSVEKVTFYDNNLQISRIPVFVSITWSLGRVIDSIANICNIKNQNDQSNTPRLRMFRELDKMCIGLKKLDLKLSDIIKKQIILNGEGLIFEYVSFTDIQICMDDGVYFLQ